MKSAKHHLSWHVGLAGLIIAGVLFASFAHAAATSTQSKADAFNFFACATSPFSCSISGMAWLANAIIAFFITVAAWIVTFMLQFNSTLINSPAIKTGFEASLSIANLGFVLAVIVIAVATILRKQSYGIKQLLWKVIVMAIVVNFGLLIAGTMISFSDGLTAYFIKASTPGGTASFSQFVTNLTTAFHPQALTSPFAAQSEAGYMERVVLGLSWAGGPAVHEVTKIASKIYKASAASDPDIFVQTVLSSLFSVVFGILILIVFGTLGVTLAVRYAYLSILLVLLPLAWMCWVFPSFQKYWSEWWEKFIRWVFFPPLVVFFLYLALFVAFNQDAYLRDNVAGAGAGQQTVGVLGFLGRQGPDLLNALTGQLVVLTLAIGGLFAANKLGIELAGAGMKVAGDVKGWAVGAVGKQARKGAGAAYRGLGGEKLTDRLRTSKIPGVSALGRGIKTLTDRGGKGLVTAEMKDLEHKNPEDLAKELNGYLPIEKQLAYLSKLQKEDKLGLVQSINGMSMKDYLSSRGDSMKSFGQAGLLKVLEGEFALDQSVREKLDTGEDINEVVEKMLRTTKDPGKLAQTYLKSDSQIDELQKKGELPTGLAPEQFRKMRDAITIGAGRAFNANMFASFAKAMNRTQQDVYRDRLDGAHDAEIRAIAAAGKGEARALFNEQVERWRKKSPAALDLGIAEEEEEPKIPPAPAGTASGGGGGASSTGAAGELSRLQEDEASKARVARAKEELASLGFGGEEETKPPASGAGSPPAPSGTPPAPGTTS